MTDHDQQPPADRLAALVADETGQAVEGLDGVAAADPDDRKRALRAVLGIAEERPTALEGAVAPLAAFLTDDERAVRLTTAKSFVALARSDPALVVPCVASLADRLADEDEFYYVRARCAEALGYVAHEYPDEVASPETLADLRVGLSFEDPAVTEKLAKALAGVALGDPRRLRHQVATLAEHLDDDSDLVRYHLATALVAVGSASPTRLADAADALAARLDDDEAHVRGRAAEALGLLASAADVEASLPEGRLADLCDDDEQFVARRARFALDAARGDPGDAAATPVGTVESVRSTTEAAAESVASPGEDGECPQCGLSLPADGPPMCPRCGAPR